MYGTINPITSGLLLTVFFSMFALAPTLGQTVEKSHSAPPYNIQGLQNLKEKFLKEDKANELKIASIFNTSKFTSGNGDEDKTMLLKVTNNGERIFYTTYKIRQDSNDVFFKYRANDFDVSGKGMKAGVWDAGMALTTHQEFDTRIKNTDADAAVDSHATMVTGVIASSGVNERAKGIAFESEVVSNDWFSDKVEVINEIEKGMLVSNHSYGIKTDNIADWYFGAYLPISRQWDEIMFNAPHYLMVVAAGNAQRLGHNQEPIFGKSSDGFDLLVGFATSKNGLVVTGAHSKFTDEGTLKDAEITAYSSFGPTDDGRIKPDIAGDGNFIFSTRSSSDSSYGNAMGTSMAAPGVSASLLLLQELYQNRFGSVMRASTLKALALHTADDVLEPGPDYKLGWGILNKQTAKEFIEQRDFSTLLVEEGIKEGEALTYKIKAKGDEPLRVSLSWTDPEGDVSPSSIVNSGIPSLVNDLDIRIEKNGEVFHPFKLDARNADAPATVGDNQVDPFELIHIENASGEYHITISHKKNLKFQRQDFSLLASGVELSACSLAVPANLELTKVSEFGCAFDWQYQPETKFEAQYRSLGTKEWVSDHVWKSTYHLKGLEMGETYEFKVRSVCSENLESEFSATKRFVFKGLETELLQPYALEPNDKLTLFPNPATNEINVTGWFTEETYFKIVDLMGNIRKEGEVTGPIDLSDLNAGVFVLITLNKMGTKSAKFFKN